MKTYSLCGFAVFFTLILAGCSAPKLVQLDPITVVENQAGAMVYRGSYTRSTDIIHTRLDLKFNWDSAHVYGKALIEARPYFYPSNEMVLDANGFKIHGLWIVTGTGRQPLRYTYNGKKIHITLDKVYNRDQNYSVSIEYTAMPEQLRVGEDIASAGDRGLYFINRLGREKDVPRQIWTQGETECNSSWFPTINDPQEKMSQEIHLTVSNEFATLSNGLLEYSTMNGDGTRTDTWRQEQPHSTYLTMIAVGDFTITKDKWRDIEVSYYTEPAYAKNSRLVFGKTPEMMEFFSTYTGVDYPWEKYSQIVVRNFVSGAMENTTASVFFDRMNMTEGEYQDENHEDIIAHELFHHWFGNIVTAESWSNLPLNEAFATYGEYLWEEHKYGRDEADLKGFEDLSIYLSGDQKRKRDVIRFDYADREQMFDEISYHKGGRILHMLRKVVGDEAFARSLNLYLTRYAYKTAEIHDLRLVFEEVTGMDLNWFFKQWFLASGHPRLQINTTHDPVKGEAIVNISQTQDAGTLPLYRIPIAVDIYLAGKVERHTVVLDRREQQFTFPAAERPDLINVDAEKSLLAEKVESKSLGEYAFQYRNAPLFMDRYEALEQLIAAKGEQLAGAVVVDALNDKNWFLRQLALRVVAGLREADQESAYSRVREMAVNDDSSLVRAAAITVLSKSFGSRDNKRVYETARKDISPAVQKALKEATGL